MIFYNNRLKIFITTLLILISVVFRILSIPHSNLDMDTYNLQWYQELSEKGIQETLGKNFTNYTPPYTYLLSLATLTRDFLAPLTAIKFIPICFDLFGAFLIYKIVKLNYQSGENPKLAAAIYFSAPSVILNSSFWGQADSIYTSLLLACLYLLLTNNPFLAITAFGAAFSVKAQAVFLLPFLVILALRKKINWRYFGIIPFVYFLLSVFPVVLLGRPFLDALLVYARQSGTYNRLSMNAPNLYSLLQIEWNSWYLHILLIGLATTAVITMGWIYTTWQAKVKMDEKYTILIAFISVALIPFLLPKMHDRYFYPADVFAIILAFYWPSLWYISIFSQLSSSGVISIFLFNAEPFLTVFGFLLNTIALAIVLKKQKLIEDRKDAYPMFSILLSWLITILVPVALLGFSINFLLTPIFIRAEYAISPTSESYSLPKSERFHWATQIVEFLENDKKVRYIQNMRFDNSNPVFSQEEITLLETAKKTTKNLGTLWNLSLALIFIFGLLTWVENQIPSLVHGVKYGGWATMGLAGFLGIAAITNPLNPTKNLQTPDTLLQLFPTTFGQNATLFTILFLLVCGFLLTRLKSSPSKIN
jgi:Gpi18-like mannosyltransferase